MANMYPVCFSSRGKYLLNVLILRRGLRFFFQTCLLLCLLEKKDLIKNALLLSRRTLSFQWMRRKVRKIKLVNAFMQILSFLAY